MAGTAARPAGAGVSAPDASDFTGAATTLGGRLRTLPEASWRHSLPPCRSRPARGGGVVGARPHRPRTRAREPLSLRGSHDLRRFSRRGGRDCPRRRSHAPRPRASRRSESSASPPTIPLWKRGGRERCFGLRRLSRSGPRRARLVRGRPEDGLPTHSHGPGARRCASRLQGGQARLQGRQGPQQHHRRRLRQAAVGIGVGQNSRVEGRRLAARTTALPRAARSSPRRFSPLSVTA
jgi:hypothetical protein